MLSECAATAPRRAHPATHGMGEFVVRGPLPEYAEPHDTVHTQDTHPRSEGLA